MLKARFMPAKCLTFLAVFILLHAQAEEVIAARQPHWAQPVEAQYNLYQMSPTLYRSALPDEQAHVLLEKLHIVTVINFLSEPDSAWLKIWVSHKSSYLIAPTMWMTLTQWPRYVPFKRLKPMGRC